MLSVAVHRYQNFNVMGESILKSRNQGRAITPIDRVTDDLEFPVAEIDHRLPAAESLQDTGSFIRRAIIDHEDMRTEALDFLQDAFEVPLFVVDRNCGDPIHGGQSFMIRV